MAETYDNLASKYSDFHAPALEIKVGGKPLDLKKANITSVKVENYALNMASGCEIEAVGFYDLKSSQFNTQAMGGIEAGATLEVSLGYGSALTTVFFGRIETVTRQFSLDRNSSPTVTITGIDALSALMGPLREDAPNNDSASEFVSNILSLCTASGAATGVETGSILAFDVNLVQTKETNFEFLKELGRLCLLSLYTSKGVVYFKDIFSSIDLAVTLGRGKGLMGFRHDTDLSYQVAKVVVTGRNPSDNAAAVTGSSDSTSMAGSGKWAADFLSKAEKEEEHSEEIGVATSESLCTAIAGNILTWKSVGFVACRGKCIGIPEIEAGKWMAVEGIDPSVNGSYLITEARHEFDESGYVTNFTLKGAKTP